MWKSPQETEQKLTYFENPFLFSFRIAYQAFSLGIARKQRKKCQRDNPSYSEKLYHWLQNIFASTIMGWVQADKAGALLRIDIIRIRKRNHF